MLLTIIATSIVTSLIVSYAWGKWFMYNLEKWMDEFFDREQYTLKSILDKTVDELKDARRIK